MSFFRSDVLVNVSNNLVPSEVQLLKTEFENLSANALSKKLADQKEGADLIDKILENEALLRVVLNKTAGTKDRKQSILSMQENNGRSYSPIAFQDEVINEYRGVFLLDICKASKKLEDFLLANADSLKQKGAIDEQVISDIERAAASRKVQNVSYSRFYD